MTLQAPAPHKLCRTLADLTETFGSERKISLCRELTKLNEEAIRITLGEAVKLYGEKEPRGEYVLVLEGAEEAGISVNAAPETELSPKEQVELLIENGTPKMDAIKEVAKRLGVPKSEIYNLMI